MKIKFKQFFNRSYSLEDIFVLLVFVYSLADSFVLNDPEKERVLMVCTYFNYFVELNDGGNSYSIN